MRDGIVLLFCAVVIRSDDLIVNDNDCPDRHFAFIVGTMRLLHGSEHEVLMH